MTVKEALIKARENIQNRQRWTIQVCARDERHNECPPLSPDARTWCAYGSLKYVTKGDRKLYMAAAQKLRELALPNVVSDINDGLGHAAVLKLYDAAIQVEPDDEDDKESHYLEALAAGNDHYTVP